MIEEIKKEIKELKEMKVEGEVFTTAKNFSIKCLEDLLKNITDKRRINDREELFDKINEIRFILYNIDDEILFEYCLECINNDDYASEENFEYLRSK